ncbi:MAG TPA: hypothetical protein VGP87_12790 [Gemmatimonadales bacterium]|nr:hypothetical protein [Gemmatimonadales bacterium]
MGIHRINLIFIEEFNSPGDLRFRVETDVRMPRDRAGRGFVRRLRAAVEASRDEEVRDLLLTQLAHPIAKGKKVAETDLIRVRRMVTGALSDPRKVLPPEKAKKRKR